MSSEEFPNTIFFFGAGASKPAGVGTTLELVKEFEKFLEGLNAAEHKQLLNEIIVHLGYDEVDIEQLMTTLEKLTTRDNDELLKFYDSTTFKIKNHEQINELRESLKTFIQQTTSVKENKINFLEPLRSFPNPVTIFSVNYDTAIEQFCNVYKLRYTDGFEYEWNPKLFDDTTFDFHLKKIHGSIMWYKTDNGNYVKLPLPPEDKIQLIFGEKATPLILYPMQKWEFVEPLLELLLQFKTQLANSEFAIIVGYSFRDSYIVRLLHESARKNRELIVILIGPHARDHYEKHLRYYNSDGSQEKIPSLLENRVLCLQYGFEQIIGSLKEIILDCTASLNNEQKLQKYLLEGHGGSPDNLISEFAKIEFLDKADEWKTRLKWAEEITLVNVNTKLFAASLRLFLIAEIQRNTESANYWLKHFLDAFNILNLQFFEKISIVSNVIRFPNFDIITNHSGSRYEMEELQKFLDVQKNLRGHSFSPILQDVLDKVTKWFYYLYENSRESIEFQKYIKNVREFFTVNFGGNIPAELDNLSSMLDDRFLVKDYDNKKDQVLEFIQRLESVVFQAIFEGQNNLSKSIEAKYPARYSGIAQIK